MRGAIRSAAASPCYKQHFARGQNFTYDLAELGRYYRDYVELMDHFDAVLPGRVHRVFYENMVEDTEGEVRRLLEYCGLPFEEGVLRFHENQRAVRTASSEQVRRPIFREGMDQWRHYEPWLDPLKQALGRRAEEVSSRSPVLIPWRKAYTRPQGVGSGRPVPRKTKTGSLMTRSNLRDFRENHSLAAAVKRALPFAGAMLAGTGVAQAQQAG